MRVSIVTISFNQGRYLARAIASVIGQDYPDIEYIVVDPGSTDDSRNVIERYAGRIDHVLLVPDQGPADGLNHGFQLVTGDVLAYVNADDALLPGAVRDAVEYMQRHPATDVVYGDGYIVDGEGDVVRVVESSPFNLRRLVYGAAMVLQQATFIRRAAYDRTKGFNIQNPVWWDKELLIDLALTGSRLHHVRAKWGVFSVYPSSITGSRRLKAVSIQERGRLFRKVFGREWTVADDWIARIVRIEKWIVAPGTVVRRAIGILRGRPGIRVTLVGNDSLELCPLRPTTGDAVPNRTSGRAGPFDGS